MKRATTIRDVAAHASVSQATVSNYINSTKVISSETTARIERAIMELDFVPNRAVGTLKGARTKAVGLVVTDATNPFFAEIGRHAEDVARRHGCVVVFCDSAGDPARERMALRTLAEMRVSGVIVTSIDHDTSNLKALRSVGAPIVLMGDEKPGLDASYLRVDDEMSGYIAMSHLLSIGRREILFVGGPIGGTVMEERFDGAGRALSEHPEHPRARMRRMDAVGRTMNELASLADAILAMPVRPDAIMAGQDMIALPLLNTLLRRGTRVPDDIAIIGHDDIEGAHQAVIPLSTVRQPIRELGRLAVELLFRVPIDGEAPVRHIEFVPELVVRESTVGATPATNLRLD